ncbi:hypothetical protein SAMN02745166_00149 [Prosthecobacter debontii]|uniref:CHASE2 domain-containing protein n=1 Tax=Prosthecobacter debontii TaxID=48467 RepID=A0A1T4WGJ7_9BACT|nr:hypothetical protein [Prosthecobacter debontii]SKA76327.1 hypothetical protein SAMN02745166_00149 [Prosthecobacter debontii]
MPRRFILIFPFLAALGWALDHLQQQGTFKQVNEGFLDFLLANSRDSFQPSVNSSHEEVMLVEMREEQREEYAGWPPPPLDWQMLLKALREYEPEVLVIPTPLNWGRPTPEFAGAVGEMLVGFPSVVLGVETRRVEEGSALTEAPAFLGNLEEAIPPFQQVVGDIRLAPQLSALVTAPDPVARGTSELGLLSGRAQGQDWLLPYALRDQERLLPTVLAQVLAHCTLTPYGNGHRLRLGPGAGAHLLGGVFLPLEVTGELRVPSPSQVPRINALDLMVGDLADGVSEVDEARLEKARVLVIGPTQAAGAPPSLTQLHADALALALALPRITVLALPMQWAVWLVLGGGALALMLRLERDRVFPAWLALSFAGFVLSILLFQGLLIWCPPCVPFFLLTDAAAMAWFFHPQKRKHVKPPTPADTPTEPKAPLETKAEIRSEPGSDSPAPAPVADSGTSSSATDPVS